MNDTTTQQRIDGIIEQTRLDMVGHDIDQVRNALVERFRDAGIEITDGELDRMAALIALDSRQLPEGTFEAYREQADPESV